MTETTTTETRPARFALDETRAAEWLAADIAAYERYESGASTDPAEIEIDSKYEPAEQYDGHDTASLLYFARANGLITGPGSIEFDYSDDEPGGGYCWLVYLDGPGDLKLSGYFTKMRHLAEGCEPGAASALGVLSDAVAVANRLLDDLAAYVAAQTRKTCDCGEAWADEPGHANVH